MFGWFKRSMAASEQGVQIRFNGTTAESLVKLAGRIKKTPAETVTMAMALLDLVEKRREEGFKLVLEDPDSDLPNIEIDLG